jgi:hypothetical protein
LAHPGDPCYTLGTGAMIFFLLDQGGEVTLIDAR